MNYSSKRCLHEKLKHSNCTSCTDSCPQQAFIIQDNKAPVVDNNRCTGCGLCQPACPQGALQHPVEHNSAKILVTESQKLGCRFRPGRPTTICIQRLNTAEIIFYILSREHSVFFNKHCSGCKNVYLTDNFQYRIHIVRKFLSDLFPDEIQSANKWNSITFQVNTPLIQRHTDSKHGNQSRRDLLNRLFRPAEAIDSHQRHHPVDLLHTRVRKSLYPYLLIKTDISLPESFRGVDKENSRCTGCGVCAHICPTGAISKKNNKWSYDWNLCNQCGACEISCTQKALTLTGKVDSILFKNHSMPELNRKTF